MARSLAEQTRRVAGPDLSHRVGVVADSGAGLVVMVGGSALTGVGRLSSYTPAAGDVVYVVRRGTGWIVLGKIVEWGES